MIVEKISILMATRYLHPSIMQSFKSIFIKPLFKSPTIKLAVSNAFFNRSSFNSTRSFSSTGAHNSLSKNPLFLAFLKIFLHFSPSSECYEPNRLE